VRSRRRDEKGASLVEVGLVLPLLILLAVGLSEVGFLVIDYITVTNAARSGARTGAAAADDPLADDFILNVVEEAACNLRFGDLEKVYIFDAPASGEMPTLPSTDVNVYVNGGTLQCNLGAHGLVPDTNCCGWPSTGRDRTPPSFDTIGVRVEFTHSSVTGIFPFPTTNWDETAVMQVEPDTRGSQ